MKSCDIVIVGGGIAGASLAYRLTDCCKAILVEAETQPGYHATGRSAALYTASYGHEVIRGLTLASRSFLLDPPEDFGEAPLMQQRGVLWIAREDQKQRLLQILSETRALDRSITRCTPEDAFAQCPVLNRDYLAAAISEPDAYDIDVNALHRGYLDSFRRRGGKVVTDSRVSAITRQRSDWLIHTAAEDLCAPIVVNAAGAWADEIARLAGVSPIGLVPKRRTVITFEPAVPVDARDWPCVLDTDEAFYFKPDAGRILASPADETPSDPTDAQPEELEIAVAVDRIESATHLRVPRIAAKWAGLRSFVADKLPVVGMDADAQGFFWLAGQGGYGIMTSPALGELAAALLCGRGLPERLMEFGITAATLSPVRVRR